MAIERRSRALSWDRISEKTGSDKAVTLTPQERAAVFSVFTFISEFPHFMIEFTDEQKDELDAFVSGIVSKLA